MGDLNLSTNTEFLKGEEKHNKAVNVKAVLPTQRDLQDAKRYGLPLVKSEYAVFVRKLAKNQRHLLPSALAADTNLLKSLSAEFSDCKFLVNMQFGRGICLTKQELDYVEKLQQIPELKCSCMYEPYPGQTATEFEQQLSGWKTRNPGKQIVPVVEPSSAELSNKISFMKKQEVFMCGVIFRGFSGKRDRGHFSKTIALLKTAGIYVVVLGVYTKKWAKTNASMLLPALQLAADAVSSWIPWGGGSQMPELLCQDWVFRERALADAGLNEYFGKTRETFMSSLATEGQRIAFARVDIVNQATSLAKNFQPLAEVVFESLFN
jgi:hypothetical protein